MFDQEKDPLSDLDIDSLAPSTASTTPPEAAIAPEVNGAPKTESVKTADPPKKRLARKGEVEADRLGDTRMLRFEIKGFKRIEVVRVEVGESGIVVIGGKNAAGKTSVLEAIECLFGGKGKVPDVPVKKGDPRAEIIAELESIDGNRYTVKRIIRTDRGGELRVSRPDGTEVDRPQEFLAAMTGTLWYDPVEFTRIAPKQQADTLRKLVGLDFSGIEEDRQRVYEMRTVIGRERDKAKGHAESLPYHENTPQQEISPDDILQEIDEANTKNQAIDEWEAKTRAGESRLLKLQGEKQTLEQQIADLVAMLDTKEAEIVDYEKKVVAAQKHLKEMSAGRIDVSTITAKFSEIELVNRKVRDNAARKQAFAEYDRLEAEWRNCTKQIEAYDQDKAEQLAAAQMPVEGLAFSEDGSTVLYNGLPLSQASGAEQLRVSVAVAMELSGGLKVALVDEGERLDLDQLRLLDQTVREFGGQVILTRVSEGPECDLVIVDGAVAEREAVAA